ncbi:hypothetical protein [Micromonospora sp. WMMD736]|uniref:hypothetical protein n=1 Tax=Micromonospora sp. WMMD736 TaxID=3404112 RepID=UPI003B92D548
MKAHPTAPTALAAPASLALTAVVRPTLAGTALAGTALAGTTPAGRGVAAEVSGRRVVSGRADDEHDGGRSASGDRCDERDDSEA